MFHKFRFAIPHYFSKHPSHELKELYWSVGIMDFANSAVALFEPIYLWTQGYSIAQILLFYAGVYFGYMVLIPLGGRIAAKHGFEHAIFGSQFAFIAYYIALFALPHFSWLIYVAPLIFAIQKSLYWPAYHADFALFSARDQRGREVSGYLTLNAIVTILGPIAGGLIVKFFGFTTLFVIVAALFLVSSIPLLKLKEVYDPAPFSYKKYWKLLWKPTHRRSALAYFGFGEELVALVLWPIFVFIVMKGFADTGVAIAISTLVTTAIVLAIGKYSDRISKLRVLRLGTWLLAGVWLLRAIVRFTPLGIVLFDIAGRTSKNLVGVPLLAMTYEHGVREDPLAIAVYFEQSLAIGKFLTAIVLLGLFHFFNTWSVIFVVSGLVTLLYQFLRAPEPLPPASKQTRA